MSAINFKIRYPLRENTKRLEAQEKKERAVMDALDNKMEQIIEWKKQLSSFRNSHELTEETVTAFVERICVDSEKKIFIKYTEI